MRSGRSSKNHGRCVSSLRGALAGIAALSLVWAVSASADQLHVGRLIQVTHGDPFADCRRDDVAGQESNFGSTLFPNTAIEPSIAVDPTDFGKVLVGHQQDRWNDGGARGLVGVLS